MIIIILKKSTKKVTATYHGEKGNAISFGVKLSFIII